MARPGRTTTSSIGRSTSRQSIRASGKSCSSGSPQPRYKRKGRPPSGSWPFSCRARFYLEAIADAAADLKAADGKLLGRPRQRDRTPRVARHPAHADLVPHEILHVDAEVDTGGGLLGAH